MAPLTQDRGSRTLQVHTSFLTLGPVPGEAVLSRASSFPASRPLSAMRPVERAQGSAGLLCRKWAPASRPHLSPPPCHSVFLEIPEDIDRACSWLLVVFLFFLSFKYLFLLGKPRSAVGNCAGLSGPAAGGDLHDLGTMPRAPSASLDASED